MTDWWEPARERYRAELDRREESAWTAPDIAAELNRIKHERRRLEDPGWLPKRPGRRMPSVWAIVQYWASRDVFDVCDGDAPHCFGCQRLILPAGAPLPFDDRRSPRERWNKALGYLARAHLVSRAQDGLDGCQNIVPLCGGCHRSMPCFGAGEGPKAISWVRGRYRLNLNAENDGIVRLEHERDPALSIEALAALGECSLQHAWKIISAVADAA